MRRAVNPWQSYRQVATQTATPGQLVLMLFDGAIRFLDRALAGFDLDDPAECNSTVSNNVILVPRDRANVAQQRTGGNGVGGADGDLFDTELHGFVSFRHN